MADARISVLLPLPLDGPFDYRLRGPVPPPGTFVRVPFGPRQVIGVVWDDPGGDAVDEKRLKHVEDVLDLPPMPEAVRGLVAHLAAVTLAPLGSALRLAMSVPAALEPQPPKVGYVRSGPEPTGARLSAARRRVIEVLCDGCPRASADIARAAGTSASVVRGMVAAGLLQAVELPPQDPPSPDPGRKGPKLSSVQARAAATLVDAVRRRAHNVTLLEGVPGSGKTEVYFEAVAAALALGRRVLVLLPEIALSAQWLARFERRFGAPPAVWHSELTAAQRRDTWRRIAEGRVDIVVGARSALFLPLRDIGLVVVDEEHDPSFKQDEGVCYHARDMAVARAGLEDAAVVLASATPSLETALAAGAIRGLPDEPSYGHVLLPARHAGAAMPRIELVDLRRNRPARGRWLSPDLELALVETVGAGEQVLLFLNRRGYAPLTICRACGHRVSCPHCSAWLVAHRFRRRLQCHHCGYAIPEPDHCPACGSVESFAASGPGVERLAEEVAELLPDARTAILTSDSPRTAREAAAIVAAMGDHALDILIGTQIVAKGHHFPDLTLVGVVDADLGLAGGDLRAGERTFQLLYQVAGRAGRERKPGRVLMQTHLPEHPVMQAIASGERDRFYEAETAEREAAGMPPFGRLAALIVSGTDQRAVRDAARKLARSAPETPGVMVLGPAPAPLQLLRGRHRERLLVHAGMEIDLPSWLRAWVRGFRPRGNLRLLIDVDPYSFL